MYKVFVAVCNLSFFAMYEQTIVIFQQRQNPREIVYIALPKSSLTRLCCAFHVIPSTRHQLVPDDIVDEYHI